MSARACGRRQRRQHRPAHGRRDGIDLVCDGPHRCALSTRLLSHHGRAEEAQMETSTTHWKLGLFLVLSLVCVVLAVSLFGTQALGQKTVDYQAYFDESVGGLGVGSSVR